MIGQAAVICTKNTANMYRLAFRCYWSDTESRTGRYKIFEDSDGGSIYSRRDVIDDQYDVFMWDTKHPGKCYSLRLKFVYRLPRYFTQSDAKREASGGSTSDGRVESTWVFLARTFNPTLFWNSDIHLYKANFVSGYWEDVW